MKFPGTTLTGHPLMDTSTQIDKIETSQSVLTFWRQLIINLKISEHRSLYSPLVIVLTCFAESKIGEMFLTNHEVAHKFKLLSASNMTMFSCNVHNITSSQ